MIRRGFMVSIALFTVKLAPQVRAGMNCRKSVCRSVYIVAVVFVLTLGAADQKAAADSTSAADVIAINAAQSQAFVQLVPALSSGNISSLLAGGVNTVAVMAMVAPQTQEGAQLISMYTRFFALQVMAAGCREIPKRNPTFAGVNQFLACIAPVNAALVALEQAIVQLGAAMASVDFVPVPLGPGPHFHNIPVEPLARISDILRQVAVAEDTFNALSDLKAVLTRMRSAFAYIDVTVDLARNVGTDMFPSFPETRALNHRAALLGIPLAERATADFTAGYVETLERTVGLLLGNGWSKVDLEPMSSLGFVPQEVASFAQAAAQTLGAPAPSDSAPSSLSRAAAPTVRQADTVDPILTAQTMRTAHQGLVNDLYLPGIERLVAAGEMTEAGAVVARTVRAPLELAFAEALIRAALRNRFGVTAGDQLYAASLDANAPDIPVPTPEELRVTALEDGSTLAVGISDHYVLHPGDSVPVQVTRRSDGAALSGAEGTTIFPLGGAPGVQVVGNLLQVIASETPFAAIPHVGWVIAANGGDWGVAQFVVVDTDNDDDLLGDAWEGSRGFDPTSPDDALEVLSGIAPVPDPSQREEIVNDLVSLAPLSASFQTTSNTSGCPSG
ncbi:MAG TPA: hypothetical protein VIH59_06155, partial [Candidatus Tectomicrobia bacterium]